MPNSFFRFKQFTVHHDCCAMKVGTDGVLLGAWCDVVGVERALDVGTGTGLIALMLAQRSGAQVDGVEIDQAAAAQAAENVRNSPFSNSVRIVHASFADFVAGGNEKYDLIVSNPPYFMDALKSGDAGRSLARHAETLTYSELVGGAARLLNDVGRLAVILPYDQFDHLLQPAHACNFSLLRKTVVYPKPASLPKRVLTEWGRIPAASQEETLIIEMERHAYSDDFKQLTRDFYLKG